MVTDVVVTGGGPVGMLLAAELRLAGVRVVILERLAEPSPHSRAFRLQPRTLDILDSRGLLGHFTADNLTWPSTHFAGLRPLLDLSRVPSRHPYSLLIPQARTEALLEEWARELGVEIRRGHELVALRQDEEKVVATVANDGEEYELDARYLVGCDGGRSTVRKVADIPFHGGGGKVSALLGDVILDEPDKLPSGIPGTMRTSSGLLMAVALEEDVTRVLTTEFGRPEADREAPVTLEELRDSVRRVTGQDVRIRDPRWLSRFSDSTRLADRYRDGRVFLAGDSAHVHFPIGAQGLNLGLQDAINLGWKLAGAVRGWAPADLLDTYQRERQPVARSVLRETQAQLALMNPDEAINPLRELFGQLLGLEAVNVFLAGLVSGVDVRYAFDQDNTDPRPLLGSYAPAISFKTADGRTRIAELLHSGRGVLLAFSGTAGLAATAAPWAARVRFVEADTPEEPEVSALLLRPDGYVAWTASADGPEPVDAGLKNALTSWFGTPEARDA